MVPLATVTVIRDQAEVLLICAQLQTRVIEWLWPAVAAAPVAGLVELVELVA